MGQNCHKTPKHYKKRYWINPDTVPDSHDLTEKQQAEHSKECRNHLEALKVRNYSDGEHRVMGQHVIGVEHGEVLYNIPAARSPETAANDKPFRTTTEREPLYRPAVITEPQRELADLRTAEIYRIPGSGQIAFAAQRGDYEQLWFRETENYRLFRFFFSEKVRAVSKLYHTLNQKTGELIINGWYFVNVRPRKGGPTLFEEYGKYMRAEPERLAEFKEDWQRLGDANSMPMTDRMAGIDKNLGWFFQAFEEYPEEIMSWRGNRNPEEEMHENE